MKWTCLLLETSGQAENKKLKRSPNQGGEESQALRPARDLSPPESATGHHEPTVASPNARGSQAQAAPGRVPAADAASPAGGLEVYGERGVGAGLGCCRWVLTTVSSAPAGLVAAGGLQSVRVAESGAQVLIARY